MRILNKSLMHQKKVYEILLEDNKKDVKVEVIETMGRNEIFTRDIEVIKGKISSFSKLTNLLNK